MKKYLLGSDALRSDFLRCKKAGKKAGLSHEARGFDVEIRPSSAARISHGFKKVNNPLQNSNKKKTS